MTTPFAVGLFLSPSILGVAAVGLVHSRMGEQAAGGDNVAEISIALITAIITPLVGALIWLIKRGERESREQAERRDIETREQTERRDKLLTKQILMLRRLSQKFDDLPAKLAVEVKSAIKDSIG